MDEAFSGLAIGLIISAVAVAATATNCNQTVPKNAWERCERACSGLGGINRVLVDGPDIVCECLEAEVELAK